MMKRERCLQVFVSQRTFLHVSLIDESPPDEAALQYVRLSVAYPEAPGGALWGMREQAFPSESPEIFMLVEVLAVAYLKYVFVSIEIEVATFKQP